MGVKRFARHAPGKLAIALGKFCLLQNDAIRSEALPGAMASGKPVAVLTFVGPFIQVRLI